MMDLTVKRKDDLLLENFFDRYMGWFNDENSLWYPSANLYEKDGNYHVSMELPGVKKDEVEITLEDGVLTVKGEKKESSEKRGTDFYIRETRCGSFSRSFRVGAADSTRILAEYKDGVLEITVPKSDEAKPKKIEVK